MNIVMRLITLIFLLIAPSFVAAELRWLCIGENITYTDLFADDEESAFSRITNKAEDYIYTIKLTGNNDKIEITRFKGVVPTDFTDCLIHEKTSFQCHKQGNRNMMFYFDYINERFLFTHNTYSVFFGVNAESYMVGGSCSELM